jgi:asparagine synthase (glutamine-hydrolysing)
MNVTRHGGIFSRQGVHNLNTDRSDLEGHLSGLDTRGTIRSARTTDVAMSIIGTSDVLLPTQPLDAGNGVILTWDGRLDNRSSIAAACELKPDNGINDAGLVAKAYSRLGPALWSSLIGDYALACWDAATKQLYLVRDPFGTRPLYYYIDDSIALWCSELSYFVERFGNALELDKEYLASYLIAIEDHGRTPYRGILSVRPGYVTCINGQNVTDCQFWNAASSGEVRMGSDADYEARFRELFAQSVERRLRVPGVSIAELSGGLDSSSIVCTIDRLSGMVGKNVRKIATVSYLYDGSRTSDERRFIKEVEQFREARTIFLEDHNMMRPAAATALRPSCLDIFDDMFRGLQGMVESLDASSLLSGFGGDQVTLNEEVLCPNLFSLIKRGKLFAAFLAGRNWAHAHRTTTMELFWTGFVRPLLSVCLQKPLTPRTAFPKSWMGPVLRARLELQKRVVNPQPLERLFNPVRAQQCTMLDEAAAFTSQCYYREQGCGDVTYPFLDRCLVEFLIGIPAEQKLRPTETRSIHRRAMKGVLPEAIRLRKSKQGPDESLLRSLSHNWTDLLDMFANAEVCRLGLIHGDSFLRELVRAKHGLCSGTASLLRVLSLEFWLRARERRWSVTPKSFTERCLASPTET